MFSNFITITLNKYDDIAASHCNACIISNSKRTQVEGMHLIFFVNFTQMNLFSKWYCYGNALPYNRNL